MKLDQFPGVNAGYVFELYEKYRQNPESVDPATRKIFERWVPGETAPSGERPAATVETLQAAVGTANLRFHAELVKALNQPELRKQLTEQLGMDLVVSDPATLQKFIVSEMARWGRDIQADGERLTLTVHNEASIPEITRYLVAQGAEVFAISPSRLSLEDIFIETVGKDGGL